MISEQQLPELRTYRRIEQTIPVELGRSFERLVVPATNDRLPVHRWFRFKEGFSADLLKTVLETLDLSGKKKLRILDPFCGAGTTLLSSQELSCRIDITGIGIERNPFIQFAAQTKLRWPEMDPALITEIGRDVLTLPSLHNPRFPQLSSFTSGRCMSRHVTGRLLAVLDAIRSHGRSPNHDALILGVAASIEQLSKVRKDGRALRLVAKSRQGVNAVLSEKWNEIATDAKFLKATIPHAKVPRVILGDGRSITETGVDEGSIDVVLTSPPYPNNIDYSEVYKLELWLLGFVRNSTEFLQLRKSTFRSHPTIALPPLPDDFQRLITRGSLGKILKPILERTKSSSEHYRYRVLVGYAFDLWRSLQQQFICLKRAGVSVFVVGNSLHGGEHLPYLIPTDLLVATLAQHVGFRVDRLTIARSFRRRLAGNHFLRESVVILRKG